MEFKLGKTRLNFAEGFKPKSFAKFKKTYSNLGSEEELRNVFDKLNGNTTTTSNKPIKAKGKGSNRTGVSSPKKSREGDNKS